MQLLDSLEIHQSSVPSEQVLDSLQDIATKVQIQSNFSVRHPDYKPLELPAEAVVYFQRLPLELQQKYRSVQLQSFLYGIYYNGSLRKALAPEAKSTGLAPHQNLENNTYMGVDLEFYDRLHESNCGAGYFDSGWGVVKQEEDGSLAVRKGGLTLHIDRTRHLPLDQQSANVGDTVTIRKPRNLVQNGFYMAVGNQGSDGRGHSEGNSAIVRVYFNLTPEGALAVMNDLTRQLNEIAIPFSFKALYNPSEYDRYDSAVLYFDKSNYEAVRQVLQSVYTENQSHFQMEVPLFTKLLAPGLGLAEEPDQKFVTKESFGTHRCQVVARGLLDAWQNGDDSPERRMESILQNFTLLGIDLKHTYLNAKSEDIYTPLELC
ncbi:MAG TPA: T3SS effector HopA1 family protein [Allocoleopsis sp.]